MSRPAKSLATLRTLREVLREFLEGVTGDPVLAESWARLISEKCRDADALQGQRFPSRRELEQIRKDARADELLPFGATKAADRLGCSRSTVYRRRHRHKAA